MTTKKLKTLQSSFSDDELQLGYSHFSYYDYLEQCKDNGQLKSFKETLKELTKEAVIKYMNLENQNVELGRNTTAAWQSAIQEEIFARMQ